MKKETVSWLDEMEKIEKEPHTALNFINDKRDSILQRDDFSDIEMIKTKYMNIFGTQTEVNSSPPKATAKFEKSGG